MFINTHSMHTNTSMYKLFWYSNINQFYALMVSQIVHISWKTWQCINNKYILSLTSKGTCPIVQAGACSIRSCLRRSHGWLCFIRSRLRRSHSALLIHYKKIELKKKMTYMGFQPTSVICKSDALPPQHTGQSTSLKTNVVYIINCVWAAVCRNVGEVLARIVYTLAFKAP